MRSAHDVIIEPVVSEKSYSLLEQGQYTFVVHPDASKTEIKQAIEEIFDVKVDRVNTMRRRGKRVRFGLQRGKRTDVKRAVVTLAAGDEIDVFEMGL